MWFCKFANISSALSANLSEEPFDPRAQDQLQLEVPTEVIAQLVLHTRREVFIDLISHDLTEVLLVLVEALAL